MARILIAGCGSTGSAVGKSLLNDCHEVYGLKRHPPADIQGIHYIRADLTIAADLREIDTNFDLVIYILSPDDRSEDAYRKVFIDGVKNLLQVFSQHNPAARFIFISSTSVYGQSQGEWVDEDSETVPVSTTGQIILQAENAFLGYNMRNCIIRFSGIYGRGKSHLLAAVTSKRTVQYEPPYYMNRIHWQDCVRIINFIANRMLAGKDLQSIYLATDDDPAPKWEVFNYLAARLDVDSPQKAAMPQGAAQNKRCSNKSLKQLGYRFKYTSYKEGFSDIEPSDADK